MHYTLIYLCSVQPYGEKLKTFKPLSVRSLRSHEASKIYGWENYENEEWSDNFFHKNNSFFFVENNKLGMKTIVF